MVAGDHLLKTAKRKWQLVNIGEGEHRIDRLYTYKVGTIQVSAGYRRVDIALRNLMRDDGVNQNRRCQRLAIASHGAHGGSTVEEEREKESVS